MSVQAQGDPAEIRRLVELLKDGRAAMSTDTAAFNAAPYIAIRELRETIASLTKEGQ